MDNHVRQAGNEVVEASRVLSGLGLVNAYGHVSARTGSRMLITPPADLGRVTNAELVEVDLAATSLPPGAPAEAWAHLAVYAARPDVAAIARAQPPAAFAAAALLGDLPLLLRGNGALTCGTTPGLAVTRMWLLAAACETWLAASASGMPRPMEFTEADSWRAVAAELMPRLWLHLKARDQG